MAYIGQNFASADLKTYLQKYRAEASSYTIPVTTIDGGINLGVFPVRHPYMHGLVLVNMLADSIW